MPLSNGKSQKSFVKNLKTEIHAGKPMKQSLAIAYAMKRKNEKKKMSRGGMSEDEPSAKGVHSASLNAVPGKSNAGYEARSMTASNKKGMKYSAGLHKEDAKSEHERVLSELKEMPKPKMQGLDDGGAVDETQESMRKAFHFADGGESLERIGEQEAQDSMRKAFGNSQASSSPPPEQSQQDKYEAIRAQNRKNFGYSLGGEVFEVSTPEELLHKEVKPGFVPDHPQYRMVPRPRNVLNVASNTEDSMKFNQHMPDRQASTDMDEEDLVDRIMSRKSKDLSQESRLAMGGPVDLSHGDGPYEDDELGLVGRIMHKRSMDYSDLDRYSEGGRVANDTGTGQEADKLPNQHDDLVLRDDLESTYGEDDNAGDDLGNGQEDEDRKDIVARIMRSRAKKDRLPSPA